MLLVVVSWFDGILAANVVERACCVVLFGHFIHSHSCSTIIIQELILWAHGGRDALARGDIIRFNSMQACDLYFISR